VTRTSVCSAGQRLDNPEAIPERSAFPRLVIESAVDLRWGSGLRNGKDPGMPGGWPFAWRLRESRAGSENEYDGNRQARE
jgi:hypothetical protein